MLDSFGSLSRRGCLKAVFVYYMVFLIAFYLFSMLLGNVGKTEFTVMFLVALIVCVNWSIEKRCGGLE